MRRGRFIAGVVLLLIGILILVASLLPPPSQDITIPAGAVLSLHNTRYSATTLEVSWSNQPSNMIVYLVSTNPTPSACSSPTGVVANGTGASGSFSASLGADAVDYVYGCAGTSFQSVAISYTQSGGVNLGEIAGGVLAAFGVLLVVLGLRRIPGEEPGYSISGPPVRVAPPQLAAPPPAAPAAVRPASVVSSPSPAPPAANPASSRRSSRYVHGAPTSDGRTLRGCAACGAVSPITGSDQCPACGAPY